MCNDIMDYVKTGYDGQYLESQVASGRRSRADADKHMPAVLRLQTETQTARETGVWRYTHHPFESTIAL